MKSLHDLRPEMEKCFRCSLCKMVPLPAVKNAQFTDACPANRMYGFHGYSTSGKQIMALALLDERAQPDEQMSHTSFACTSCGYGDVACKFIMATERQEVNMALKAYLVEHGWGRPEHERVAANLRDHGHPLWPLMQSPGAWTGNLDLKKLPLNNTEILLFAGCHTCTDDTSATVARKLALLLRQANVDFGILGEAEGSCGLPAYWTGHCTEFAGLARTVTEAVEQTGVKKVVTAGGSCFGALHAKYPEAFRPGAFEVLHASQLLLKLVVTGKLKLTHPVNMTITYHDPCYLGRQSEPPVRWQGEEKTTLNCMTYSDPPKPLNYGTRGVYDAPRKLLSKIPGLKLNEMYRIREYAFCCGGGGGAPEAFPELATATARHRLEEAQDVKATAMVTACHHCRANLQQAQQNQTVIQMPVYDIIDLVFQATGLEE